jgi:uncharacterized membrane protein
MKVRDKTSKEQRDIWHADPQNWKWGIFYYNPEDNRLLPPKKIKSMGWTVNFANPWSILVMLMFFIMIFVLISFLKPILDHLEKPRN